MRIRVIIGLVATAALIALAVIYVPEMRLREGLIEGGIPRPIAGCMAKRMAKRLSYAQLWKLADLPNAHGAKSRKAFLHNVRALGDAEIDAVTASSFVICGIKSPL